MSCEPFSTVEKTLTHAVHERTLYVAPSNMTQKSRGSCCKQKVTGTQDRQDISLQATRCRAIMPEYCLHTRASFQRGVHTNACMMFATVVHVRSLYRTFLLWCLPHTPQNNRSRCQHSHRRPRRRAPPETIQNTRKLLALYRQ